MTNKNTIKTTVYTSDSWIKNPGSVFSGMWIDLKNSRELAWRLFVRDIKGTYRQSILGIGWAFIGPFVTTLTWLYLNYSGLITVGHTEIPYPIYIFSGTLLWSIFTSSLNAPSSALGKAGNMLTRVNFPKEAILLTEFLNIFFYLFIRLILVIPFLFYFGLRPGLDVIFLPLGFLSLFSLGLSIGFVIFPFKQLYGDFGRIFGYGTTILMYTTPVIFPMKTDGWIGTIFMYNPLSYLIITCRNWLTGAPQNYLYEFYMIFLCSSILMIAGLIFFRIVLPHLVVRMGA